MAINLDLDTQLAAQLTVLSQQAVANTGNFAHFSNLAFTKDLMQSGQESNPGLFAGFNSADRTPVVKTS